MGQQTDGGDKTISTSSLLEQGLLGVTKCGWKRIKKGKLRDWRRINAGRGKKGELSYSCCKSLWPLTARPGQIVATLRGLDGVYRAYVQSQAENQPKDCMLQQKRRWFTDFPYYTLVFCSDLISGFGSFLNALEKVKNIDFCLPSNLSNP